MDVICFLRLGNGNLDSVALGISPVPVMVSTPLSSRVQGNAALPRSLPEVAALAVKHANKERVNTNNTFKFLAIALYCILSSAKSSKADIFLIIKGARTYAVSRAAPFPQSCWSEQMLLPTERVAKCLFQLKPKLVIRSYMLFKTT